MLWSRPVLLNMVTMSHVGLFKGKVMLIKIKLEVECHSRRSHISSAQWAT